MKTIIVAAMVFATSIAFAQQPPAQTNQAGSVQTAPNPAEFDKQMAQVQENVKKMQEQMTRIEQTQDPQARQRLLQEHWASMQSAMSTMHGMWGNGLMGCCGGHMMGGHMMGSQMMMGGMMGWSNAGGYYSQLTPEQMRQRQYMTDQYLAMQQMMMSHMMWHEHWLNQIQPSQK